MAYGADLLNRLKKLKEFCETSQKPKSILTPMQWLPQINKSITSSKKVSKPCMMSRHKFMINGISVINTITLLCVKKKVALKLIMMCWDHKSYLQTSFT